MSISKRKPNGPGVNLFDRKVNKEKHSVLNKSKQGTFGKPSQSKQKSYLARKKALIPELKQRGRKSNFVDRRFGENSSSLSTEDKMMARYSRERSNFSKRKSAFNLDDTETSTTLTLTHRGKDIDELDFSDDDDLQLSDDDDDDGTMSKYDVSENHFGSGAKNGDGQVKTKTEVMRELIGKSKMHKFDRQKIKEENSLLCNDIDEEFETIAGDLVTRDKEDREKRLQAPKPADDYFDLIKKMTFDKRSQPTDSLKVEMHRKEAKIEKSMDKFESDEEEEGKIENGHSPLDFKNNQGLRKIYDQVKGSLADFSNAESIQDANRYFKDLRDLAQTNSAIVIAQVFRERMSAYTESIKSHLLAHKKHMEIPGIEDLMIFHLIALIFDGKGKHHIVSTPAIMLMIYYIHDARIESKSRLVSALFLAQILSTIVKDSKKYVPELIAFLYNTLACLLNHSNSSFLAKRDYIEIAELNKILKTSDFENLNPRKLEFEDLKAPEMMSAKLILEISLYTLYTLVDAYYVMDVFPEIFIPFNNLLNASGVACDTLSEKLLSHKRSALKLQKFKAVPIPQYDPEIGDSTSKQEREHKMLQKAYKRELKGAKRELKRDAQFLANHQVESVIEADSKYQKRIRSIMGSISNESNNFKQNK